MEKAMELLLLEIRSDVKDVKEQIGEIGRRVNTHGERLAVLETHDVTRQKLSVGALIGAIVAVMSVVIKTIFGLEK